MLVKFSDSSGIYVQIQHSEFSDIEAKGTRRITTCKLWDLSQVKIEDREIEVEYPGIPGFINPYKGVKKVTHIETIGNPLVETDARVHSKDKFTRHKGVVFSLTKAINEWNIHMIDKDSIGMPKFLTKEKRKLIWEKMFNKKFSNEKKKKK